MRSSLITQLDVLASDLEAAQWERFAQASPEKLKQKNRYVITSSRLANGFCTALGSAPLIDHGYQAAATDEKRFGTRSMYSARGDALRAGCGEPSGSESLLTAAPRSDCAIPTLLGAVSSGICHDPGGETLHN